MTTIQGQVDYASESQPAVYSTDQALAWMRVVAGRMSADNKGKPVHFILAESGMAILMYDQACGKTFRIFGAYLAPQESDSWVIVHCIDAAGRYPVCHISGWHAMDQ